MEDSRTCTVLFPDGAGIRNFVHSGFLDLLGEQMGVDVWHALNSKLVNELNASRNQGTCWHSLPTYRESLPERIARTSKIYAQLYQWYRSDNSAQQIRLLHRAGSVQQRLIRGASRAIGWLMGSLKQTAVLDRIHFFLVARNPHIRPFVDELRATKPSVLFCTHQRAASAVPAMVAARILGIPTATFIYSWDNLPKGRMAVHADHFLIWSRSMAQQLARYYPEVARDRVHVTGTPQFAFHCSPGTDALRVSFLAGLGLNPSKKTVCFSGDDITTSPFDQQYLEDVAWAIRQIPENDRPQILFRRCPIDDGNRYQAVLKRYPEIRQSEPLWTQAYSGIWAQAIPSKADAELLSEIVNYADCVINVGSTMAMDFAIREKPGIFLRYTPEGAENHKWSIESIYQLPHFRSVHELQPVHWARSREELIVVIQNALANPLEKQNQRAEWLLREVAHPVDSANNRCIQTLLDIAAHRVISEPRDQYPEYRGR